jgi:N-carbamoylputrescine amidase
VIIASLFERRAAGVYHNTAAIIDADGSLMGVYRKMHIPDDPLFYEKFYFTPWRHRLPRVEDQGGDDRHVGLLGSVVPGRRAPDRDAGRRDPLLPHRDRLAPVRAQAVRRRRSTIRGRRSAQPRDRQRLLSCAPNRIGHEIIKDTKGSRSTRTASCSGASPFVASPDGQVVERAPIDKETVMVVDCDLARVEFSRTHWPFLRDRRIDAYGSLTKRFQRLACPRHLRHSKARQRGTGSHFRRVVPHRRRGFRGQVLKGFRSRANTTKPSKTSPA